MALLNQHDANHPDALMRPMQSFSSKARRALWNFAWTVLCRPTPKPLHRWRCAVIRLFGGRIGKNNFIYPSARIWAPWLLETGDVATIASGVYVYNVGGVKIGHHAIISEDAFLCGASHDFNSVDFPLVSKPIEIGPYAWICARAVVLPGVHCGDGAVLGAAAVSSKDLQSWKVHAGNPARILGDRARIDQPPNGQATNPAN
ncbi:putative colanic acid biosynthesis acetyltransferase [Haloferula chungangensis]|uniref:Colanic acid biosynthesis acetyltransferase n=1 Tax=Haloferula chungangensis TaxID=1048331 RepID=A0ABW2L6T2_9BACT